MKQVVISVIGGVANIEYISEGVVVDIVDFDNAEEEGDDGDLLLEQAIEKAKKDEKESE